MSYSPYVARAVVSSSRGKDEPANQVLGMQGTLPRDRSKDGPVSEASERAIEREALERQDGLTLESITEIAKRLGADADEFYGAVVAKIRGGEVVSVKIEREFITDT